MFNLPETIFVDSSGLRANYADRDHLLDKVKKLSLLPDNLHATTELVARYYEVPVETIKSVVKDNRVELESNGYRVLEGEERAKFVRSLQDLTLPPARHLAIFSRRAVLNVGMLAAQLKRARPVNPALCTRFRKDGVTPLAVEKQSAKNRLSMDELADINSLVLGAIARLSYRSRQAVREGRGWTLAEVEQNVCWAVEELVKG